MSRWFSIVITPYLLLLDVYKRQVMAIVAGKFNMAMRRTFAKNRRQVGEVNAQVEDSLLGVRVVKSFTGEAREIEKFEQGNRCLLYTSRCV